FNKEELISRLETLGFPESEVILTFEEFFDGNECESSIGVNVDWKPSISVFRATFKELLDRELVDKVFVRVVDIEEPEEWVFSDTVYVIGKIDMQELSDKLRVLKPEDIQVGWYYGEPVNVGEYDQSKNIFTIYWD